MVRRGPASPATGPLKQAITFLHRTEQVGEPLQVRSDFGSMVVLPPSDAGQGATSNANRMVGGPGSIGGLCSQRSRGGEHARSLQCRRSTCRSSDSTAELHELGFARGPASATTSFRFRRSDQRRRYLFDAAARFERTDHRLQRAARPVLRHERQYLGSELRNASDFENCRAPAR